MPGVRTIDVAKQAGVNPQTLRYYERRGLLPEPHRTGAGYRAYDTEAVQIVRFVKHAQALGFSLAEVESLLHLARGGPVNCQAAQDLATEKLDQLDAKIAALQAMRASLERLVDTCQAPHDQRDCPLLDALDDVATESHA